MTQNIEAILETVKFVEERMVNECDGAESESRLDDRLTAVEGKITGIHNRTDDKILRRADLEKRVRSVVPDFPRHHSASRM